MKLWVVNAVGWLIELNTIILTLKCFFWRKQLVAKGEYVLMENDAEAGSTVYTNLMQT